MPNGDQHAAYRVFELKAGEAKEIYLETVKKELDELLEHIELPEITLEDLDGKAHTLNDLTKDGPILLAFLGTGEEPTEHVLNELIEIAEKWNAKRRCHGSRAPHEKPTWKTRLSRKPAQQSTTCPSTSTHPTTPRRSPKKWESMQKNSHC